MPIQRCTRQEEQGWQWGDEGTCYLASEEGSDEDAKKKAIAQAVAAGASPDEFRQHDDVPSVSVIEFATLKDVELFEPGTHNQQEFSEDDIVEMLESSTACLPFILKSIEDGHYEGNEKLNEEVRKSGNPIPAFINLGHQRYFKDIKQYLTNIGVTFKKAGNWLKADITNIKDDVALMLQEVFNARSIELIKELFNPLDGKTYRNVIRSIGFLPANIPPAVSGQNPKLTVEYAQDESVFVTLYALTDNHYDTEESTMPTQNKKKGDGEAVLEDVQGVQTTNPDPIPDDRHDAKLVAFEQKLHALEEQNAEATAREAALKARLELAEQKAQAAEQKQEQQDIAMYCKDLAATHITGKDGAQFIVAPSVVELVKPIVEHADNSHILEFSDTNKTSMRPAIQQTLSTLLKMAAEGTLLVPVGGMSTFQHHAPPEDEQPKPKEVNRASILEMYGEDAKASLGIVEVNDENNHKYVMKAHDVAALDDYRRIIGG